MSWLVEESKQGIEDEIFEKAEEALKASVEEFIKSMKQFMIDNIPEPDV